VADMVSWSARGKGRILQLTVGEDGAVKVTPLYSDRNLPHGLALGPDGRVYVGDDDRIWRFDPKQDGAQPETLVDMLPDKRSFGGDHWHPLKHIVFDNNGDLLVNMGAPNDGCENVPGIGLGASGNTLKWPFPCPYGEADLANAALWKLKFDWPSGTPGEFGPIARGLRNSVALAVHPKSGLIVQAENGADAWNGKTDQNLPPDELNVIVQGRHYGWPYCAGAGTVVPEYRSRVRNCQAYEAPYMLIPAHSAPLGMMYYGGTMFPELKGKLLIAMHGFRDNGHRIVAYNVDAEGKPLLDKAGDKRMVVPMSLVSGWTRQPEVRPMGRPLGIVQARDGAIWFVDDKAHTVMILLRDRDGTPRVDEQPHATQLHAHSSPPPEGWGVLYHSVLQPRCQSCHEELREDRPEAAWGQLAAKGLVDPQTPRDSAIIQRMFGEGAGNPMPMPTGLHKFPEDYAALKAFVDRLPKH
jgi:glucose/arabinose dehydrogenase